MWLPEDQTMPPCSHTNAVALQQFRLSDVNSLQVQKNTVLRLNGPMNSGVCRAQASLIYCIQLDIFKQKC